MFGSFGDHVWSKSDPGAPSGHTLGPDCLRLLAEARADMQGVLSDAAGDTCEQ